MSDEKRDDEYKHEGPEAGESEFEWFQRLHSPELQMRHLFNKLNSRVETNEKRAGAFEEESRRRSERIERTIEFLASQQARFSTDLQQSRQDQDERWQKADARWAETEKGIRALLAIAEIHEREIGALKDSQERTGKQLAETGERVDALVDVVEQLISERRNGGGKKEEGSR